MKTACKAVALALVVLAGGLFFAAGCSTGSPGGAAGEAVSDRDIVGDVQDRLRSDPETSRYTFSISSDRGVVTVGGVVPDDLIKSRVLSIIRGAPGVKTVVDDTRR